MPRMVDERIDTDTLGGRLTRSRLQLGWTQQQVAAATGTSQAVVQRIEAGKCRHPRNIERLAEVLRVSPSWLMYGVEVQEGLAPEAIETARAWRELREPHRSAIREMIMKLAGHAQAA